jgi:hypothetical protein
MTDTKPRRAGQVRLPTLPEGCNYDTLTIAGPGGSTVTLSIDHEADDAHRWKSVTEFHPDRADTAPDPRTAYFPTLRDGVLTTVNALRALAAIEERRAAAEKAHQEALDGLGEYVNPMPGFTQ